MKKEDPHRGKLIIGTFTMMMMANVSRVCFSDRFKYLTLITTT